MRHHVRVMLPVERTSPGWLYLMGPGGEPLGAWPCLGQADSARGAGAGNPGLLSTRPYGHTPEGRYMSTRVEKLAPPHPRMGEWCIPLVGITGAARVACSPPVVLNGQTIGGRTGLAIHAGGPGNELRATYGCIRVGGESGETLVRLLGDSMISVVVEDLG